MLNMMKNTCLNFIIKEYIAPMGLPNCRPDGDYENIGHTGLCTEANNQIIINN